MIIKKNKTYHTENNLDVLIYNVSEKDNFTHGAIKIKDRWEICEWDKEGKHSSSPELNLVKQIFTKPLEELISDYEDDFGDFYIYENNSRIDSNILYFLPKDVVIILSDEDRESCDDCDISIYRIPSHNIKIQIEYCA